jgi:hypothetical protein
VSWGNGGDKGHWLIQNGVNQFGWPGQIGVGESEDYSAELDRRMCGLGW